MFGPAIRFLKSGERVLLKNISCLISMDAADGDRLGIHHDVDVLIVDQKIEAIGKLSDETECIVDCSEALCLSRTY